MNDPDQTRPNDKTSSATAESSPKSPIDQPIGPASPQDAGSFDARRESTGFSPDRCGVKIEYKHSLAIRWMHWINFPLLALMIYSGLLIYWADSQHEGLNAHRVYRVGSGSWTLFRLFPPWFYNNLRFKFQLAIYKPTQLHVIQALLGGYEMACWLYFWLTIAFVGFFLVHVAQVIRAGWNSFRAMIIGYQILPAESAERNEVPMDKTSRRAERDPEAEIHLRARRGFLIAGAATVAAGGFWPWLKRCPHITPPTPPSPQPLRFNAPT